MKRSFVMNSLILMILMALLSVVSAASSTEELTKRGAELIQESKWQEAAEIYEQLTQTEPKNAQHWNYLGLAQRNLEKYAEAVAAYEQALSLNDTSVFALAGLSITLEKRGETQRAFDFLNRAVENGLSEQGLKQNPAFEGLRKHPQFEAALKVAEKMSNPCRYEPPYDDFDFWLGDWDVHVGGQQRAENLITKEMNGCLIRERYHNQLGYEGESINYYDPETGKWKQNWVDRQGGIVRYSGGLLKEGVMHMEGANTSPGGKTQLARVTWTLRPDGSVHHLIEQSTDGGKTWQSYFDGIYIKSDRPYPAEMKDASGAP